MEIRMESTDGALVGSPSESIRHFERETRIRQREWVERLANEPDAFSEIEQEIDQHYRLGAGHLVAALLGRVTSQPTMVKQVEQIRREAAVVLRAPQQRPLRVRLFCPDHLAELVAYHLHRLGVASAELVVFVADGARWIWDRLDWIERRAGLDPSRTVHVLDFCHAAHHISLALKALGLEETPRRQTYGRLRKLLKRSRYDQVVEQLQRLARGQPEESEVWTEIRYLKKHGQQGHLQYATFRRRGIPCGSGAIESSIRRVINQRLKSNAMYWLQENAEAMFAVRATLLCDRWEETLTRVRQSMVRDRRLDWKWNAPDTSSNLNADTDVRPPQLQPRTTQQSTTTVA